MRFDCVLKFLFQTIIDCVLNRRKLAELISTRTTQCNYHEKRAFSASKCIEFISKLSTPVPVPTTVSIVVINPIFFSISL
jgi:hypothetical protein